MVSAPRSGKGDVSKMQQPQSFVRQSGGADAERACGAPTLAADDHQSLTRHGTSVQTQDDRGWINAP